MNADFEINIEFGNLIGLYLKIKPWRHLIKRQRPLNVILCQPIRFRHVKLAANQKLRVLSSNMATVWHLVGGAVGQDNLLGHNDVTHRNMMTSYSVPGSFNFEQISWKKRKFFFGFQVLVHRLWVGFPLRPFFLSGYFPTTFLAYPVIPLRPFFFFHVRLIDWLIDWLISRDFGHGNWEGHLFTREDMFVACVCACVCACVRECVHVYMGAWDRYSPDINCVYLLWPCPQSFSKNHHPLPPSLRGVNHFNI